MPEQLSSADVLRTLRQLRVLPVLTIADRERALGVADALAEGGLPVAEVTFRTTAAADALRRIADGRPELLVGAGTVLRPEQADAALDAGARFIVAPGLNPEVVEFCLARAVPVFPGVATPTEIEHALRLGLRVVKFFPAEPMGGVAFLRAVAQPYGEIEFIPTGGVRRELVPDYLATGRVVACGGSWMVPNDWVAAGDFARIRAETAATVAALAGGASPSAPAGARS